MVKLFIYYAFAILQFYLGTLLTICVFSLLYLLVLLSFYVFNLKDHAVRQITQT